MALNFIHSFLNMLANNLMYYSTSLGRQKWYPDFLNITTCLFMPLSDFLTVMTLLYLFYFQGMQIQKKHKELVTP